MPDPLTPMLRHSAQMPVRLVSAVRGWRWARSALSTVRAGVRSEGLDVAVPSPPTTSRGSLRGARLALRRERASCLERSLITQRWWASNGIALDVIVGVRHPALRDGPTAHAWVEHYEADCSDRFNEIRRVKAPEGKLPRIVP